MSQSQSSRQRAAAGRRVETAKIRRRLQRTAAQEEHEGDESADSDSEPEFATPLPPGKKTKNKKVRTTSPEASQSAGSTQQSQSQRSQSRSQINTILYPVDELVTQAVHYFILMQAKKVPLKKSEIVKNALHNQTKDFREVVTRLAKTLDDIFGCQLIGIKGDDAGVGGMAVAPLDTANMFMIISRYTAENIEPLEIEWVDKLSVQKKAFSRVILSTLYMLNRDVEEEFFWLVKETLEAADKICPRREDLRKFLKTEFVDPMYLTREETKGVDGSTYHYAWGIRAELECDKYQMLRCVARSMRKLPHDFKTHYFELLSNEKYSDRVRKDRENNRDEADALFDNATATENSVAQFDSDEDILDVLDTPVVRPKEKKQNVIDSGDEASSNSD